MILKPDDDNAFSFLRVLAHAETITATNINIVVFRAIASCFIEPVLFLLNRGTTHFRMAFVFGKIPDSALPQPKCFLTCFRAHLSTPYIPLRCAREGVSLSNILKIRNDLCERFASEART